MSEGRGPTSRGVAGEGTAGSGRTARGGPRRGSTCAALVNGVLIASLLGALAGCAGQSAPPEVAAPSSAATPSSGSASDTGAPTATPTERSSADPGADTGTSTGGGSQSDPGTAATPVLGSSSSPNTKGYGSARPRTIDGGQDSAGIVSGVTWSSWGGSQATGSGTALYSAPGQSAAEGTEQKATVVAADLGRCGGKPAYRKLTWYFPQHGEKLDLGGALDICPVGQ